MNPTLRQYDPITDYDRVGQFLVNTHRTSGDHVNWLQPRWEYMHFHPYIRRVDLGTIGIWEAGGEIVGVVHPEHSMGTAYVQVDPDHGDLKVEMLRYAEETLSVSGGLRVYIHDEDAAFQKVARDMGYTRTESTEPMSHLPLSGTLPLPSLPQGYRLRSLAEDNDLRRVDRVLWRGFDHGDEPPEGGLGDRKFMQSAPSYSKDLNIVVVAPDGNFAAYCGMWYEPVHTIAYVEPVATDPDHRRLGLASAAVMEGIRRCRDLGATVAYVGATMPIYVSLGFRKIYGSTAWIRGQE